MLLVIPPESKEIGIVVPQARRLAGDCLGQK